MNRRSLINAFAATATAMPLAGCFGSDYVVKRIKIIAKAEADGKPVEGTTVMEITWRPRGDGGMDVDHLGEALVLELAGRGTVFMLPMVMFNDGLNSSGIWYGQVGDAVGIKGGHQREDLPKIETLTGRFKFFPMVKGATFPLLVAFKDENEFRSIYRLEPEKFSEYFGAGVKFVGVEFEITDEQVTKVLAKRLPILLEKDRDPVDPALRKVRYVDLPFNQKIGQNSFFAIGRY
jgi:hypothetical protein